MSDAVLVAVVVSVGPTLIGLLTWWETRKVKHHLNSRLDQLIEQAEAIAHAAGVKEGQKQL